MIAAAAARARAGAGSRMRSFDPRVVGAVECRAWETYYRREWAAFLVASVRLVRAAFRMSWPRNLARRLARPAREPEVGRRSPTTTRRPRGR